MPPHLSRPQNGLGLLCLLAPFAKVRTVTTDGLDFHRTTSWFSVLSLPVRHRSASCSTSTRPRGRCAMVDALGSAAAGSPCVVDRALPRRIGPTAPVAVGDRQGHDHPQRPSHRPEHGAGNPGLALALEDRARERGVERRPDQRYAQRTERGHALRPGHTSHSGTRVLLRLLDQDRNPDHGRVGRCEPAGDASDASVQRPRYHGASRHVRGRL
jgi:hypothetical protein